MLADGSQGCKQWRQPEPAKTTEFGPEPQAASDSSRQLTTHKHTTMFTLCVCVSLSYSVDDP